MPPSKKRSARNAPVSVVGIGASAGGIEALQGFFDALPPDLGHAYVVILHLSPHHPSELDAILARRTRMPVAQVRTTVDLQADHVYVVAPNCRLEITDTQIGAAELDRPHGQRTAIDVLFRSLAAEHGDGFAIILSGGGTDGVLGCKAIREGGGLVLVQDPLEAAHSGMPEAVIAAGLADFVGYVRELAARLVGLTPYRKRMTPLLRPATKPPLLDPEEARQFDRILELLLSRTGHDFSQYRHDTLLRRLARRMQITQVDSLAAYLSVLRRNPEEAPALLRDLLITVTAFFRDREAWNALANRVVGPLVSRIQPDETIRVWVAGCATGEEAYTAAILFLEEMERRKVSRELLVFATDIDPSSLETARDGVYPATIEMDVSRTRLERHFTWRGEHYRVTDALRNCIVFAHHSLLRDPPFADLHLVCCRSLLTYMQPELQDQVQAVLRYAGRDDGYLFLGTAESASPQLFSPLDQDHRIYRMGGRPAELGALLPARHIGASGPLAPFGAARRAPAPHSLHRLHLGLLEKAAPPSVLVNRERVILHLSESAGRFMQPRGGEFAGTVDSLLRQELRQEAQQALERAFEEQEPCQTAAVAVQFDGTSRSVSMIVHPRHTADEEACALLMFLEAGQAQPPSCAEDGETGDPVGSEQREKLRRAEKHIDNLASVHESTLQDLRVANEELQSLNEEYRSMAEELETSKEELQSVNEELQTVNAELRSKLEETSRARNDLENLMAATQIATLFLDRDLCIKRFTPPLRELFNITPRDEGRPIGDFTHLLDYPDLQEHARRVLSDLNPISHEVPAATGETLMVRLFPYRTSTDRIDGVVITFVDISQAKRSELQSLQSKQQLENELRTTQRLHRMSMTVATANDQQHALDEILAAAIDLLAADFGTIQTWDASHPLKIVASHGIRAQLLSGMERIHSAPGSATMRALESGALVHVGDVLEDEWYAPHREFAAELGYRSILSTPLFDDDGKVLGFLTTLYREPHKSTERTRQLAELLAQQASQLLVSSSQQQRLAELYSELSKRTKIIEASEAMLKRQTEILREQDMAKEDFLGLLGHELRNPLAAVRNSLEALRRTEAAGGGKSGWPAGLKIIERQSAHMTRLVNDLLDVSRINQGKLQLAPESIDIRACIEELAAAAETAAKEARLRLVLDLPTTPLRTVADPQRIVQVLDNLVRNAIQFTDAGGTVTIRARHAEGRIRIAVSDTGIGMDPAQIESLFGAYRQGAQRRRYGGLGLGLTLSRRLVQLHGGTLSAHSDGPGTGSEFVIDLPARQQAKAAAPKSSGTPPERRRVLIVDDDRDNARSMAVLLESMGQETSVALEGEGALAAAREFQPQVVLMDLSMPGMGGVEIAQRLRSEEFADQSFTLVAVSGHSQQKVPEPFDHYVMKPAALNDLLDILRSAPLESARVNP